MRNSGLIAALLCFFLSGGDLRRARGISSKPLSPLEQTLISNTNAVPEAQKSRNVDFLKRTLTDDFVFVGSEGKLHDKEEIVGSASEGELKDYYTYNLRVLPVNDQVAVVTYDCIIHMPEGDAPGMAPRYQHLSDLWVKQNDEWRLGSSRPRRRGRLTEPQCQTRGTGLRSGRTSGTLAPTFIIFHSAYNSILY